MPFFYGRWDDAAQAHVDIGVSERSRPVRDGFAAPGAFHPAATREQVGRLAAPVLVYAGELDANPTSATAAAAARLFPNATVTVQPGAAYFPWLGLFRPLGHLGEGDMGRVYLGESPGRKAAIKVIRPGLADDCYFLVTTALLAFWMAEVLAI